MTDIPEVINRAKVLDTRKEGAFVVKILAPEIAGAPIEPNSVGAMAIAEGIRIQELSSKKNKRANPNRMGYSRR